ncbi:MAG: restriction endonuclease [Pseudomonadota bacterium]|nr:restriction endonuclease [Pseudomonadota bacterium]
MTAILQQDIIDHLAIGDAGNSHEKGKALEDVVENTMCLIDGVGLIDRNVEDMPGSLEIDLILYNHQVTGTGLPFFPALLIIECKNWAVPVNAATLRAFTSKVHRMKLKFGLLVAANGITCNADDLNAAHAHLRDTFNRDDEIILVITRTELCGVASTEELGALLRKKYGRFIMGMASF